MRASDIEEDRGFVCDGVTPAYVDALMNTYLSQLLVLSYTFRSLLYCLGAELLTLAKRFRH